MSIVRRIVDLMGGSIWVESEPGRGSTLSFFAWFGLASKKRRQARAVPSKLIGMRVLVVDDNAVARKVMCGMLQAMRFRAQAVASGEEAVESVAKADGEDPFGLVLMDWKMPGMGGLEATRRVTQAGFVKNAPAVLMQGASGSEGVNHEDARAAGAAGLVEKPMTASVVFNAINGVFAPPAVEAVNESAARTPSGGRLAGARVLLAEDNEINQQIACELLRGAGIEVVVAGNGREAVEMLARESGRFDMVLMDIQMPEMDGYEATRRIRSDARFVDLPIIAMTAHALVEERQKVLEVGMNDHISKPIDPDVMFETLRRHFHKGRSPVQHMACVDESPAEQVPVPEIEGFDMRGGIRRVAGNVKLYWDLLRRFVEGQHDAAARVREALQAGDAALAERVAHTVKGVSGNLGAGEVQAAAGELERCIAGGDVEAAKQILERFASALQTAIARVSSALDAVRASKPQEAVSAEVDAGTMSDILDKLLRYAESSDSEANEYLASVRGTLVRCCSPDEFGKLESSLRSYDFSAAVKILRGLQQGLRRSPPGDVPGEPPGSEAP